MSTNPARHLSGKFPGFPTEVSGKFREVFADIYSALHTHWASREQVNIFVVWNLDCEIKLDSKSSCSIVMILFCPDFCYRKLSLLLQVYCRLCQWKNCEKWPIPETVVRKTSVAHIFWTSLCVPGRRDILAITLSQCLQWLILSAHVWCPIHRRRRRDSTVTKLHIPSDALLHVYYNVFQNKKLSCCWETVRRESMPRIAEMDMEMTT